MKFEIKYAKNGVILEYLNEDGTREKFVYQETEGNEIEAFVDFLYLILENYGPATSRYSPKRIYIRVEPGDKYEPPSKN